MGSSTLVPADAAQFARSLTPASLTWEAFAWGTSWSSPSLGDWGPPYGSRGASLTIPDRDSRSRTTRTTTPGTTLKMNRSRRRTSQEQQLQILRDWKRNCTQTRRCIVKLDEVFKHAKTSWNAAVPHALATQKEMQQESAIPVRREHLELGRSRTGAANFPHDPHGRVQPCQPYPSAHDFLPENCSPLPLLRGQGGTSAGPGTERTPNPAAPTATTHAPPTTGGGQGGHAADGMGAKCSRVPTGSSPTDHPG
jgi:hypothetical protein